MRKILLATIITLACISAAQADPVYLYVDAAPNAYGSDEYDPWWNATKAAVVGGSFHNMANGINSANVDTTNFEIQDEVVYSFGDLGKRLTWIYWVPDKTIEELTDANFLIGLTNIWDGDTLDFYDSYYGSSWLEPTKWEEFGGGVIGTAGMAWWGAYNTNTQAALDADIAAWIQADESWIFTVQMDGMDVVSMTCEREGIQPVPAPGAALLAVIGLGLVGWLKRRFA